MVSVVQMPNMPSVQHEGRVTIVQGTQYNVKGL